MQRNVIKQMNKYSQNLIVKEVNQRGHVDFEGDDVEVSNQVLQVLSTLDLCQVPEGLLLAPPTDILQHSVYIF